MISYNMYFKVYVTIFLFPNIVTMIIWYKNNKENNYNRKTTSLHVLTQVLPITKGDII